MVVIRPRGLLVRALLSAALMLGVSLTAGCGADEPDVPMLAMPDLVGQPITDAEVTTYDALHTSLIYYDLSPADRATNGDWIIVATTPAAGERTPKFDKVHAWALQASEYRWFQAHPTMPRLPARADVAGLLAPGGPLAAVKDLVRVRYQPGKATKTAKPDAARSAFKPDRGLHPDLATEPAAEFALRKGLLVAPTTGTRATGLRPTPGTTLRPGQLIVLLVVTKPPKKALPPPTIIAPDFSDVGGGSSSGGSGGGGGGIPGLGGFKPPKIPNCPQTICR